MCTILVYTNSNNIYISVSVYLFEPYFYTDISKNIEHYNSWFPSPYQLCNVTTPTYIHTCGNDAITTPTVSFN